jgi:hypothetical protein
MAAGSRYGRRRAVEPNDALLEEVHRTAGHVAKLGRIVAGLSEDELVGGVTRTVESVDGGIVTTTQTAPNIWLRLYQAERKALLDACRTAAACGVQMANEQEADQVDELSDRRTARLAGGADT